MKFLDDLAAKVGRQKTEKILPIKKTGDSGSFRWPGDLLFYAADFTREERFLLAVMRAAEFVHVMKRAGLCAPAGYKGSDEDYYTAIIEAVMLLNGFPLKVHSVRLLMKEHEVLRRDLQRAFAAPWWLRRPGWWPFG